MSLGCLLDSQQLADLRSLIDEIAEAEGRKTGAELLDSKHIRHPTEPGVTRLADLVNKGAAFDQCYTHPRVLSAVNHVLQTPFKLSALNYRAALPDAGAQKLHVDWHEAVAPDNYQVCISIWLLDDFTTENGATRVEPDPHHPFTPPGKYWDMYNPDDIELPVSFGLGSLPPVLAMQDALKNGTDARDNQNPFAVTADEARAITALTYGMITMIDDAVGRVLAKLEALDLKEDTVVVFTSDHGDYMGDHGLMLKLLLHYQGLIKVPFIWSDAKHAQNPLIDSGLASSIDIAATILARAGIQTYNGMQGRDLFTTEPPQAILVEEDSQRTMTGFDRPQRVRTAVTERYRMSLRQGEDWNELYDLHDDPNELVNLYDDHSYQGVRNELMEIMIREIIGMQDRAPMPAYRA